MQDIALLILRVATGIVFITHGLPKIKHLSWGEKMGLPKPLSIFGAIAEFFGGIALLLGIYTQIAAILVGTMMIGALYFHIFKWKHKFYNLQGDSWEYAFMLLIIAITIYLLGPGMYSLDAYLF